MKIYKLVLPIKAENIFSCPSLYELTSSSLYLIPAIEIYSVELLRLKCLLIFLCTFAENI
jgi:hypothetical protein